MEVYNAAVQRGVELWSGAQPQPDDPTEEQFQKLQKKAQRVINRQRQRGFDYY
jgi:hypothetical protein